MTTDDPRESPAAQIEALTDLLSHPGWHLYRQIVLDEIAGDFENTITKALDVPDTEIAIDRMRQVAAVRKAGLRWLKLPKERLETLQQHVASETRQERPTWFGRRPAGL